MFYTPLELLCKRSNSRSNNRLSISPGALYSPLSYESMMAPPNEMTENRNAFLQSQIYLDQAIATRLSTSQPSIYNESSICDGMNRNEEFLQEPSFGHARRLSGPNPRANNTAENLYQNNNVGAYSSSNIDISQTLENTNQQPPHSGPKPNTFNDCLRLPMEVATNSSQYHPGTIQPNSNFGQNKLDSNETLREWLVDAQVNPPFKPNTISAATNFEWRPDPSKPQR